MEIVLILLLAITASAIKAPWTLPKLNLVHGELTVERLQMSTNPQPKKLPGMTDHILSLTRRNAISRGGMYLRALREQASRAAGLSQGTTPLIPEEADTIFLVGVTVGGQDFKVILDTGSSDPWLVVPGYECVDIVTYQQVDESQCYFGTPYNSAQSSTFTTISNQNMNLSYSDGEFLTGSMGYETFTMGGITVPQQKFGLVDYAGWLGDGYSSGLIGFAYSTITSAYAGDDPYADKKGATLKYNTLFTNMWNDSLIAPVFTLVLNRDPNNGGLLALGGIPNIPHSPVWVSAPIQSVGVYAGTTKPAYEYYSIECDGFAVAASPFVQFGPVDSSIPNKIPIMNNGTAIVDSGTSLVYVPNPVADAVADAFNPPAVFSTDTGMYTVDCGATAPTFGASVGNKIFYVNGADLVAPDGLGGCISGVQPNNGGLTILGDVWMKNVIVVHDIGAEMMRFAAREFYGLTSDSVSAPGSRT